MACKQFTIGFSRTVNLGNYESARVEASVVMDVDADGNTDVLKKEAQVRLRALLLETWEEQKRVISGKREA